MIIHIIYERDYRCNQECTDNKCNCRKCEFKLECEFFCLGFEEYCKRTLKLEKEMIE